MDSNHQWTYSRSSQFLPFVVHTQPFREVQLTRKDFSSLLGMVPYSSGGQSHSLQIIILQQSIHRKDTCQPES